MKYYDPDEENRDFEFYKSLMLRNVLHPSNYDEYAMATYKAKPKETNKFEHKEVADNYKDSEFVINEEELDEALKDYETAVNIEEEAKDEGIEVPTVEKLRRGRGEPIYINGEEFTDIRKALLKLRQLGMNKAQAGDVLSQLTHGEVVKESIDDVEITIESKPKKKFIKNSSKGKQVEHTKTKNKTPRIQKTEALRMKTKKQQKMKKLSKEFKEISRDEKLNKEFESIDRKHHVSDKSEKTEKPKPQQQPPKATRTKTKNDADTGAGLMFPQEHQQVKEQEEKQAQKKEQELEKVAQQFAEYEQQAFDLGLDEKPKLRPLPQRLMRARNPPPLRGRRTGASQQPPTGK